MRHYTRLFHRETGGPGGHVSNWWHPLQAGLRSRR